MKDSFGVEIEEGDYILSASTTHGRVKVGTAFRSRTGNLSMRIDISAQYGRQESEHPRSGQLGHNVVVLRKADGTVPAHVGVTPPTVADVEDALRNFMAHQDYDQHKALECDEETGEDCYPQVAEDFYRSLMGGADG
ncbi:hypothetical protein [Streptomyces sp. NRRL S-378]|uniref:hypothetical protein n=1 Tax=Streptomyces sp. NRRL S-378 TaxID=1463904 RepID=UPI0004CBAD47|nr:hypothetical protein [Streptomyces sp. NRRL S-378]